MSTNDDRRPPDSRPPESLDAFLNSMTHGKRLPHPDLDPALARTVREMQRLADATVAANMEPRGDARTWEALMRGTPSKPRLVARPYGTLPRLEPATILAPPSRLRRFGSKSLGLVATLTLVAMIGLSGLAVYLSAPQRDDPATVAGVAGASPTATVTTTDSREIFYGPCDVTPRDYDELMDTVSTQLLVPEPVVPYSRARTVSTDTWGPRYRLPEGSLPDGSRVSTATQAEIVDEIGVWMNCTPFLRTARSTDDYLVRLALEGPLTGWATFSWWLYSHPDLAPAGSEARDVATGVVIDPRATELAPVGTSTVAYAYGFRMLDDRHVAAYLASPIVQTSADGAVSTPSARSDPLFEERGYVVFALQPDGQWLVDEFALNRRG